MKTRILNTLTVLLVAASLRAQTPDPDQLVQEGRALLKARNLRGAQNKFLEALKADSQHPDANALAGATRLLLLPQATSISNFLNRLGFPAAGRDPWSWTSQMPRDTNDDLVLPPNLNSSEAIGLIRSAVLQPLRRSQANLAMITDWDYMLFLTPEEVGADDPVKLDYGDVQLLRAMLYAAEFVALTLDTAISNGQPRMTVRSGSVTASAGTITTEFSGVDGWIINNVVVNEGCRVENLD